MAKLHMIKAGQTLYTSIRQSMGNTTRTRIAVYPIRILVVDAVNRQVLATCNSNPQRWYPERHVLKWKVKKPVEKQSMFS